MHQLSPIHFPYFCLIIQPIQVGVGGFEYKTLSQLQVKGTTWAYYSVIISKMYKNAMRVG
jgi:hypothetical protein